MAGPSKRPWEEGEWQPSKKKAKLKRENKNQPQVLSSKKQISRYRVAPGLKAPAGTSSTSNSRDPRFDPMGGSFDEHLWRQKYSFLLDSQKEEISTLKERLKQSAVTSKSKSCHTGGGEKKRRARGKILTAEEEAEAKDRLSRLQNRVKTDEQKAQKQQVLSAIRKEELGAIKEGKTPFYHKKSEIREKELQAKYEELEKSGKLKKFMAKRRQKLQQKQQKQMPNARWEAHDED